MKYYNKNIMSNNMADLEDIKKWAESDDAEERSQAAEDRNCPIEILTKLSEDEDEHVIGSVVFNINCPAEIL